jgi:hypothetical protein
MAKSDKKKGKLPKEVGGIKVPKQLRKAGNKAMKLAKDPVVSEVVAAALLSAAAALREKKDPKAVPAVAGAASDAAEGAKRQANKLSDSLKVLAIDLARRALDGMEKNRAAQKDKGGDSPASGAEKA